MAHSNDDSNSSSQRLTATTGDEPQRSHDGASTWHTPRLKIGRSRPLASPPGPETVQRKSTATPPTANGFVGLRATADQPQRPRATLPPRVRIEGVRGSNPLSSTLVRECFRTLESSLRGAYSSKVQRCWLGTPPTD